MPKKAHTHTHTHTHKKKKKKEKEKKRKKSTSTINAYINTKAFYTHSEKYKYYKCIHQCQHISMTIKKAQVL